jgi:23S rRNA pseudouridine1911/1915/1917 synthase
MEDVNRGYTYVERLPREAAGRALVDWLAARHTHSDTATWRQRIERGEVSLDGRMASAGEPLRAGSALAWRRPPWDEPAVPLSFAVLHRDPDLLAVAKPRGLPSVPNGGFLEHTLLHRVRRLHPEAVPMHRLGRGTSGLTLFTRSEHARRSIQAAWRSGGVEKTYLALARGHPHQAFSVDAAIGPMPHPRLGSVHAASATGRPALSHVRLVEPRGEAALVAVTIATGRPHQIRIHLAVAGHPLVGDPLYESGGTPRPDALPGEGGYWLHAWQLALTHPGNGRTLKLECAPPPLLR